MEPQYVLVLENDEDLALKILGQMPPSDSMVFIWERSGRNACLTLRKFRKFIDLIIVNPKAPWVEDINNHKINLSFIRHISTPCSKPKEGCKVVVLDGEEPEYKHRGFIAINSEEIFDFISDFFKKKSQ